MLHAVAGKVLDGNGVPVILRGVNLSPWLDPQPYLLSKGIRPLFQSPSDFKKRMADLIGPDVADTFWQKWTDSFVTEDDFRRMAEQGINCVRLPVNYKDFIFSDDHGTVSYSEAGIAPVDRAIAWGQKYGIYVILDLHYMPGGQNTFAAQSDLHSGEKSAQLWSGPNAVQNQTMAVDVWRAIAARYTSKSSVGGYDLVNEPNLPPGVSPDALHHLYAAMIAAIRTVDGKHMLIVEGNGFAHDFSELSSINGPNILYEFHEYSIFNPAWKTPNAKALQPFLDLRTSTQRPIWLGEFGEESLSWQTAMVQLMNANQIGWAVWPWKRIDLGNGHPVLETINAPNSWQKLCDYLGGAMFTKKPTPEQAEQAMSEMIEAVQTSNCREDPEVLRMMKGE